MAPPWRTRKGPSVDQEPKTQSIIWRPCGMQVPVVEVLEVSVWDNDPLSNDQCLGVVEIDIAEDVAKVAGGRIYKTWYLEVRSLLLPPILNPHVKRVREKTQY